MYCTSSRVSGLSSWFWSMLLKQGSFFWRCTLGFCCNSFHMDYSLHLCSKDINYATLLWMIPIKSICVFLPSVSKKYFFWTFHFGVQPNKSSRIHWEILQECEHVGLISKTQTGCNLHFCISTASQLFCFQLWPGNPGIYNSTINPQCYVAWLKAMEQAIQ